MNDTDTEVKVTQYTGSEDLPNTVSSIKGHISLKDSEKELFDLCSLDDSSLLHLSARIDELPTTTASKTQLDCVKSSAAVSLTPFVSTDAVMLSLTMDVLSPKAADVKLDAKLYSPQKPQLVSLKKLEPVNHPVSPSRLPPVPPPFKCVRPTYLESRPPILHVQIAVRRLALGCNDQEELVLELCLSLIDQACALRHVPARHCASESSHSHDTLPASDGLQLLDCQEMMERDTHERSVARDSRAIQKWMNESPANRHDRTSEVLRTCLEGCALCIARVAQEHNTECASAQENQDDSTGGRRRTGEQNSARRLRLSQRLMSGCLLPLIEECLAVGMEDMLQAGALFPKAVAVVHAIALLGG
eukprot:CAMPEP_0172179420 /NCGR_PEP_ID=MMETSP1050-20130122/16609_1 /TAXON_ID=233186 /ORGANISM="Cryptomonas curvata, Strain CCAP979/52" /LENGTH=359 /DNA_ID=CAMNT_0012852303 /DNA_START=100 /DNA_END=1176 /DNA_ORIENTATION=+